MNRSGHKILLVTLFYAIGASLWILCSDLAIGYIIDDPTTLVIASTVKDWGFVAVTALLLYLLQKRFTAQTPAENTGTRTAPGRNGRALYPGIIVAIASIVLLGAFSIRRLTEENTRHTVEQLQAIAALKAEQIGHWLEERARYAELVSTHSSLGDVLQRWRRDGDGESRDDVLQQLVNLRRLTGFQALFVIDRSGRLLIGDGSEQHTSATLSAAIERAFSSGQPENTGFYREDPGSAGDLHLDFVAVIADEPELALILRLNERSFPFPFLQEWPMPSASAETLLFKADGDSVLFLNELRHRHDTALKLRVPFSAETVLAVQMATGRAATGEPIYGNDYRGEPVVGVARSIHGTPWYLIAKIDRKEADAEPYIETALLGLALFLALLAVVAGALLLRQRKELHTATELQRDLAESSLDIVFQTLPDQFFRIAADGVILDYRAQRIAERDVPPRRILGRRMQDVLPPGPARAYTSNIEAALDSGELTTFEYALTMPQGEQHYEARLARLSGNNELIAIVRNISERRRVLRKLDNTSRMYATRSQINQTIVRQPDRHRLFQEICDIAVKYGRFRLAWIGLVDDQGKKIEVVASSGEATDYTRNIDISLSGDPNANGPTGCAIRDGNSVVFNDLEHNPDFLPWRELALQQGLRSSGAFPLRLGENVIGALSVYAAEPDFFDAEEINLLREATQDISFALDKASEERIRRRTEQALRDSEAHLRTLIDSLPDLVWLKNPDGVYQFCNTRFERFFGAKEADIVGRTDYDFTDEAQAGFFRERDRATMAAGRPSTNEEQRTYADDGHTELVETVNTPMYNTDGELIGVLGIGRDITEHIRAETRLAAQLEELQRWRDVTLERELRGLELKSEINALLMELGRPPRYPSALQESRRDE
ncbi:MAG: PAS domain-containing protein [Gammaproteobacteria bacterium]|nr:PAS domain-containing protein [Gammaproteobacteria bacterium]